MFNPDFDPLAMLEELQRSNLTLLNNQQVLMRTLNQQAQQIRNLIAQQTQLQMMLDTLSLRLEVK